MQDSSGPSAQTCSALKTGGKEDKQMQEQHDTSSVTHEAATRGDFKFMEKGQKRYV